MSLSHRALCFAALALFACSGSSSDPSPEGGRGGEPNAPRSVVAGGGGTDTESMPTSSIAADSGVSAATTPVDPVRDVPVGPGPSEEPDVASTPTTTIAEPTAPSAEPSAMTTAPSAPEPAPTTPEPTPAKPADWVPVTDPPDGFSDCEESNFVTQSSCAYRLRCDGRELWSGCEPGRDGGLQCACLNYASNASFDYLLQGSDLASGCRVGLPLCYVDPVIDAETAECVSFATEASADSCDQERVCAVPIAIAEDVVAEVEVAQGTGRARCHQDGNAMRCECEGSSAEHFVYGTDGTNACEALVGACVGLVPFGDEFYCRDAVSTLEDGSCSNLRDCGIQTVLTDAGDVYALSNAIEMESACMASNPTGWASCSCVGQGSGSLGADVEGIVDSALCAVADEICLAGESLPSAGPVECPDVSPYVNGESCSIGSTSCTQAASFGTYDARVTGWLNADCAPTDQNGQWSCQCSSGDHVSEPFISTSGSPASACSEAFAECTTMATGSERLGYGAVEFSFQ